MDFRSMNSIFILVCLIIISFLAMESDCGRILHKSNEKNLLVQRLKRTIENVVYQNYKQEGGENSEDQLDDDNDDESESQDYQSYVINNESQHEENDDENQARLEIHQE